MEIDTELNIEWRDAGAWRSYHVTSQGDTLDDLIENATISEIDQDGGELDCYGISEASFEIYDDAIQTISRHWEEVQHERKNK